MKINFKDFQVEVEVQSRSMSVREQFLAKQYDTKKLNFKGSDNEIK